MLRGNDRAIKAVICHSECTCLKDFSVLESGKIENSFILGEA